MNKISQKEPYKEILGYYNIHFLPSTQKALQIM